MDSKGDGQDTTASEVSPGERAEDDERHLDSGATQAGEVLLFLSLCAFARSLVKGPEAPPAAEGPDTTGEERERKRLLLEQKLASLNAVANMCMTWWVSSVVFCGSILAGVWLQREEIVKSGVLFALGLTLSVFFAGVVAFGAVIWRKYLPALGGELSDLARSSGVGGSFSNELSTFRWGMGIGTGSFFFILVVWLILWCHLSPGCQDSWLGLWCRLSPPCAK